MLDYPLPRIRRLLEAASRLDAQRNAALVQVIAMGSRGTSDDIAALQESLDGA